MLRDMSSSVASSPRGPSTRIEKRRKTAMPLPFIRLARLACLLTLASFPAASAADPAPQPTASAGAGPTGAQGGTSTAWSLAGDPVAGAEAYAACAVCHGEDGGGRPDGTFPRLAGQHASVLAKQISDICDGRRGNPIMASHLTTLTDPQEMADLAAYIAAMPAPAAREKEASGDVTQGRALYERDCARCHGERGQGNAASFVPMIAGQYRAYVLRQLQAIAGSLRHNADPAMVNTIFDYRDQELRAVAAYVASLPWPKPAEAP
jgi:cytochrome c553